MSVIRCDSCSALIDSDADPDCFVEVGNMRAQTKDVVWCGVCRTLQEDEIETRRAEPAGLDAFIADCIAADPRHSCDKCDWDVDGCRPCAEHEDC